MIAGSPYEAFVLDADGTLFDFARSEERALGATLAAAGIGLDWTLLALYRSISAELWRDLEEGRIDGARLRVERFARLAERAGLALPVERVAADYLDRLGEGIDLLPGAEAVVTVLARRVRLLLATNGLATVQRRRFARSPLRPRFAGVLISEEAGSAKPQPAFFAAALAALDGPPPAAVLVVGDSLSADIAGAAAAGLDSCWFNPRREPLGDGFQPRYVIADLAELPALVDRPPAHHSHPEDR